jgi:hypothetical protein
MLGFSENNNEVSGFRVVVSLWSEWFLSKQTWHFFLDLVKACVYNTSVSLQVTIFKTVFGQKLQCQNMLITCCNVTNKCIHFVRIISVLISKTPTCFGLYWPIITECTVVQNNRPTLLPSPVCTIVSSSSTCNYRNINVHSNWSSLIWNAFYKNVGREVYVNKVA